MIVLDTNVISEIMRETPDGRVMAWLGRQKTLHLAVTTLTLAEIRRGLRRLPAGARRRKLEASFAEFIARGFEGRILSFDEQAAATYGEVYALRESKGLHADPLDLMIAAVAKDADASLATRNTGDFSQCGIKLINPWEFKTKG